MKKERAKMILEAAAKLPPAKGRVLVAAVCAKDAPPERTPGADAWLEQAAEAMTAAMEAQLVSSLEGFLP